MACFTVRFGLSSPTVGCLLMGGFAGQVVSRDTPCCARLGRSIRRVVDVVNARCSLDSQLTVRLGAVGVVKALVHRLRAGGSRLPRRGRVSRCTLFRRVSAHVGSRLGRRVFGTARPGAVSVTGVVTSFRVDRDATLRLFGRCDRHSPRGCLRDLGVRVTGGLLLRPSLDAGRITCGLGCSSPNRFDHRFGHFFNVAPQRCVRSRGSWLQV